MTESSSSQAARCADRSSLSNGVQEARTSTSVAVGSPPLRPKPSVVARVTVPLSARCPAPWASKASVSQLHATWPSSGSPTGPVPVRRSHRPLSGTDQASHGTPPGHTARLTVRTPRPPRRCAPSLLSRSCTGQGVAAQECSPPRSQVAPFGRAGSALPARTRAEPHQTYCEGAYGSSALTFSGYRNEHTVSRLLATPGSFCWRVGVS